MQEIGSIRLDTAVHDKLMAGAARDERQLLLTSDTRTLGRRITHLGRAAMGPVALLTSVAGLATLVARQCVAVPRPLDLRVTPYALLSAGVLLGIRMAVDYALVPAAIKNCKFNVEGDHKPRRVRMHIDGFDLEAHFVINDTQSKKWILFAGGNGTYAEEINYHAVDHIASQHKYNLVTFNYPGVAKSSGCPHRRAMANAYRALMRYLEESVKASDIVLWGHSIGGGVCSDATVDHEFSEQIRYLVIKQKTFSSLDQAAAHLVARVAGWIVSALGWGMDCVRSSQQLAEKRIQEIVIQQATEDVELGDQTTIEGDGPIHAEASLAYALFAKNISREHKTVIGDYNGHMGLGMDAIRRIENALS